MLRIVSKMKEGNNLETVKIILPFSDNERHSPYPEMKKKTETTEAPNLSRKKLSQGISR